MYYTVYKITNKINTKEYIGVHQTKNLDDGYMGSGKYLKKDQLKFGLKYFEKSIIFYAKSKDIMYWIENMLVDKEYIHSENTYNVSICGTDGRYSSWSAAIAANTGTKWSQERKENHSISLKKYYQNNKNSNFGRLHICNYKLNKEKEIIKEDLEKYINEGWIKGYLQVNCPKCNKQISKRMLNVHQRSKNCRK